MNKNNILFLSSQPQRFREQEKFALDLKKKIVNSYNIKFFLAQEIFLEFNLLNFKFEIINKKLKKNKKNSSSFITNKNKRKLVEFRTNLSNFLFFNNYLVKKEKKYINELNNKYNEVYDLLKREKISIVFINGDRHLGDEPIFIKACNDLKIPLVIPYMVFFAEKLDLVKTSITSYLHNTLFINPYIKKSQNKFYITKYKEKFYYPHYISNALEKFGVLSSNPWFVGNGNSDILCLPNAYLKNHYKENGVPSYKIRVVGDISYDSLYISYLTKNKIRSVIFKKYNLDFSKKLIIIALPQLAEHNQMSWTDHWKEIDFLMKELEMLNCNILVSLHPKMDRKNYEYLEEKYTCSIFDEMLSELLPCAEVFLATYSSTILWSILCSVKTMVFDFYSFNYSLFDFLKSLTIVDEKKLFHKTLEELLRKDIDFKEDWESLSRDEVFNGKTIERYINIIKELN